MTSNSLSNRVAEVCDDLLEWVDEPGASALRRIRGHVRSPLSVAVVGPVKAGKSTLVNALIGRRMAPTSETECTRVVTWYRFGKPQSARVILRDGGTRNLPLEDGLPAALGVELAEADRIDVTLPEAPLKSLTIIDTPGLASLTVDRGDATRDAVIGEEASRAAAGQVDAILYLFLDTDKLTDIRFVEDFAAATGDAGASSLNTLGVLSRADEFGEGAFGREDPFDAAERVARRLAEQHANLLADVVPVSAALAEARRCGRLNEPMVAALARLADVADVRLNRWQSFRPHVAVGVSDATMEALHRIIKRYGVLHGRHRADGGASMVNRWLDERSGLARLQSVIDRQFTRRADVLKAGRALAAIRDLCSEDALDPAMRQRLAALIEHVQEEPGMHRVRELRAVENLRRRSNAPADVVGELEKLLAGHGVHELLGLAPTAPDRDVRAAALARAAWGKEVTIGAGGDLELAEAGRVLSRSYLLLARQFGG